MSQTRLVFWGTLSLLLINSAILVFVLIPRPKTVTVVRKISATSCFQQGLPGMRAEMRLGYWDPLQTEGIGPRTSGQSVDLYCPIPSDSLLPHAKINNVVLNGWGSSLCDGGNCLRYVLAYLCVSFASVPNGTCTNFRLSGVRGDNYAITFSGDDLYIWRRYPNGYPYIRVAFPVPSFNGDTPTLRGITVSGLSTFP